MEGETKIIRNLAAIVLGVAGSKEKIETVWPLWSDHGSIQKMVLDAEMYEEIKKAHGLN